MKPAVNRTNLALRPMKALRLLLALSLLWPSLAVPAAAAAAASPEDADEPIVRTAPVAPIESEISDETREALKDRVGAGDVVSINLFPGEEYSREVTVQPDGRIQMALIGSVMVKGLTLSELQDRIRQRYSKFLDRPQVTANIRKYTGRRVAIIGEVLHPGYFDFRDGMKLLEIVSQAGGFQTDANQGKIRILRPTSPSLNIDFRKVLAGDLSRNPKLAPGDTIFVPQLPLTHGAGWVNRNILPWLIVITAVTGIVVSARR